MEHLVFFIKEYFSSIFILIFFAFSGLFAIIPFAKEIKYALLIAPLAGFLFLITGTSVLYSLTGASLVVSAVVAWFFLFVLSIITLKLSSFRFQSIEKSLWCFLLIFMGFILYGTEYTSLILGHPGLLYMDGSDHLGYAHLSDWLKTHTVHQIPRNSPSEPYQQYPYLMWSIDPRFGVFIGLALVSIIRALPGFFSYDCAQALILMMGCLAVSAVFGRRKFPYILLFLGLLTSYWYDYGSQGYLGKLLGYPTELLCIGLFLHTLKIRSISSISVIAILVGLVCASASVYPANAMILFLITAGFVFILIHLVQEWHISGIKDALLKNNDRLILLALLIGVALATSGILVRPYFLNARIVELPWSTLLPQLFDLEANGPLYTHLSSSGLFTILVLDMTIVLIFLILSIKEQAFLAVSMMLAPLLLLIVLGVLNQLSTIYQLEGIFYPWFLCGAVYFLGSIHQKEQKFFFNVLACMLVVVIATHIPRLKGALARYAGADTPILQQYSKLQMDELAHRIGQKLTTVDISDITWSLPILVEFGRQSLSLQYMPKTWGRLFAYTDWPAPSIDAKASLILQLSTSSPPSACVLQYKTAQYALFDCSHSR